MVVRTKAHLFNLDVNDKEAKETGFIDDFEQLMDPDTFVNAGLVHFIAKKLSDKDYFRSI